MTGPVLPMLAPALGRAKELGRGGRESAAGAAKLSNRQTAGIGGFAPPVPANDFSATLALVAVWRRRHGRKAAAKVAAGVGAPLSTVEKWFAGAQAISGRWWPAILASCDAAFLDQALGGSVPWLTRAAAREALERTFQAEAAAGPSASPMEAIVPGGRVPSRVSTAGGGARSARALDGTRTVPARIPPSGEPPVRAATGPPECRRASRA